MAKSPAVIPFSTDGVEIPLKNGITLPTDARGFISVGLDGTTARFVVVDSSGRQVFVGAGVAGTPAGGVVSVQGVAGGTAIPISAASLPLPTGAATETTLASRLADATFTARINTLGQKTMANSTPVVLSSDQSAIPVTDNGGSLTVDGTITANIGTSGSLALDATLTGGTQKAIVRGGAKGTTTAADVTSQNVDANTQALHVYIAGGGGSGGTASNFGAAFPSQGTAGGFFDGTNMQGARVFDADSGAGSQFVLGAILRKSASGGSVEAGTSTDPLRTDPTGTTAQPVTDNGGSLTVDGTVTANQGGTWTVQQGTPPWSVVGAAAEGAAPSGNPVLIAGQDGTNVQTLKTDTTGRQEVIGGAANGVAVAGNPVRIGGSDGTLTRDILTDTSGRPRIVGAAADGAAIAGDPVLIAGQDGTNVQSIRTLTDGTVQVRYKELATFTALATATVVGNNKSMLSIVNASGSTVQVRVLSIHVVNVQTTAVTGVTGTFEVRRCVNHSAGTAITAIETMDSTDTLNGSVTVRTNGTITTESANLLWRALFSTDEWGPGTQDVESGDHIFQTMFPIWKRRDMDAKPILLRANEGLTVKFATNSTAGRFDILVVFTQE